MVGRVLFIVSYCVMLLTPVYVLLVMIFGDRWGPASLLPLVVFVVPAAGYLSILKCRSCGKKVYSVDHAWRHNRFKLILPFFRNCPECGHPLT